MSSRTTRQVILVRCATEERGSDRRLWTVAYVIAVIWGAFHAAPRSLA
jgi:hypothetical protein